MGFLKNQRQKVVENVEVYSKHVWLRLAIVVVLVLVGISLLAYAITNLLSVEKGWREIELNEECYKIAPEIKLNYNLGASGASATLEYQRLSDLYSDIALKASKVFDSYEEYDGVGNLATISSKLNSEVSVDPLLYDALKLITDVGDRHLYLAPLYIENTVICSSNDDDSAVLNDPEKDEIAADYFLKVMEFAGSDDHIRLELRDTNKVTLKVSKEYKAFIDEWQIDTLIDLHWLKNAFIVDAIADELIAQGYTYGNVTAYNGFFRNLDKGSQGYDFDIYSLNSKKIYRAATISLSSASSVVSFRSFPLTSLYPSDDYTYYVYEDGTVVSPYLSYEDGLNRCAVQNLVSAAPKGSCAEIALSVYKYYSADSLDTAGINSLKDKGIKSAWIDGVTVYYNDDSMKPKEIFSSEEIEFELKKS